MSARSRALNELADHYERLLADVDKWNLDPLKPVYDARDHYRMAADMARRTARENRWRDRLLRRINRDWA